MLDKQNIIYPAPFPAPPVSFAEFKYFINTEEDYIQHWNMIRKNIISIKMPNFLLKFDRYSPEKWTCDCFHQIRILKWESKGI